MYLGYIRDEHSLICTVVKCDCGVGGKLDEGKSQATGGPSVVPVHKVTQVEDNIVEKAHNEVPVVAALKVVHQAA